MNLWTIRIIRTYMGDVFKRQERHNQFRRYYFFHNIWKFKSSHCAKMLFWNFKEYGIGNYGIVRQARDSSNRPPIICLSYKMNKKFFLNSFKLKQCSQFVHPGLAQCKSCTITIFINKFGLKSEEMVRDNYFFGIEWGNFLVLS